MNSALGIAVVFDFITLIAVETGLEIFVVGADVGDAETELEIFVVGIDNVVIGYLLFDVGIVDVVVEENLTCEELVFIVVIVFVIVGACAISV